MEINYQTIALALGVVGTVLGIINSYWAVTANRVRLSVRPYPVLKRQGNILVLPRNADELKDWLNRSQEPKEISLQVMNTGRATAWITGLGFIEKAKNERFNLVPPELETNGRFPLNSNEQKNIPTKVTPELRKYLRAGIDAAFAEAAGGKVFVGSTDVWESYLLWLKKPNHWVEKDAVDRASHP